jgi:transcriptional regulator with XRE-family HTH domain
MISALLGHRVGSVSEEEGRRVRAALALAGKTPEEVAPELNISARTLGRVIAGERQLREWEVQRLATVLEVPPWFLTHGLAGADRPSEDDRLSDLERMVTSIDKKLDTLDTGDRLAAIEAELRRVASSVDL